MVKFNMPVERGVGLPASDFETSDCLPAFHFP